MDQLADFTVAGSAEQRQSVIQSAKFPSASSTTPYAQSRSIIAEFLARNTGDVTALDAGVDSLRTQHRREPNGWVRDELQKDVNAILALKKNFSRSRLKRHRFTAGPAELGMNLEGVCVKTRLDALLREEDGDGNAHAGGVILLFASTATSRARIEDRSRVIAAMVHWCLDVPVASVAPLERLCFAFDVLGSKVTKAPTASRRLRTTIRTACCDAAAMWDSVAPPPGHGGPDWT